MGNEAGPTALRSEEDSRGAGGKVRKPPSRKPQATPYDHPTDADNHQRRWLSKLVDPACRLIAGGATHIFPSFFSKSKSCSATTAEDEEDPGVWQTVEKNSIDDDHKRIQPKISSSTGVEGLGGSTDKLKSGFNYNLCIEDEKEEHSRNDSLSEIEKLVKRHTFSRDQVDHLLKILNSSTSAFPNVDRGSKTRNLSAGENEKVFARGCTSLKLSDKVQQDDVRGAVKAASTLFQANNSNEAGASPLDVPKAYMLFLTSEAGLSSEGKIWKGNHAVPSGDETAIKQKYSAVATTSTCGQGALVKDACLTRQNQRERYGFQNFPRTPYSRNILSRSAPKVQTLSSSYESNGGCRSVGPIRRLSHKSGTSSPWRDSLLHSSIDCHIKMKTSSGLESVEPILTKFFEPICKPQLSETHVPAVHSFSNLMARKILEHIDRNPPTPKQKSEELRLAIKMNRPESSGVDPNVSKIDKNQLLQFRDSDHQKHSDSVDEKSSVVKNEDQGNSKADIPHIDSKASNELTT